MDSNQSANQTWWSWDQKGVFACTTCLFSLGCEHLWSPDFSPVSLLQHVRSILWFISVIVAIYIRSSQLTDCIAWQTGTNQVWRLLKPWWNRPFPTLSKWLGVLLPVPHTVGTGFMLFQSLPVGWDFRSSARMLCLSCSQLQVWEPSNQGLQGYM